MKLNLWMIANRLSELEPELHIPDDAPNNLLSARRVYATQCVYVYQKGSNVICDGGENGGFIVFKDMNCDQVFEMVQFTFDFYCEWQEMIIDASENLDYHRIIDKSWTVFHNPIMLLDANNNILAMSEQYGEDDVNEDWKYLCQNGRSSVSVIQYLMEYGKRHEYFMNGEAKVFHFSNPEINGNQLTVAIYDNNESCGRINIVEKDHLLNPGDVLLANYLAKYLTMVLRRLNEQGKLTSFLVPAFSKMVLNQPVHPSELAYWKAYTHWQISDCLQIVALQFQKDNPDVHETISICNLLQSNIPDCIATQVGNVIAFSFKISKKYEQTEIWNTIYDLAKRFYLKGGFSLFTHSLENIHYYFEQAVFAIRYGNYFHPDKTLYNFFDYAIDYIISAKSIKEASFACQTDIKHLWNDSYQNGGDQIETLRVYLNNDRSLIATANELFVHRNTLVYRLKKITNMLEYSIDDNYVRDYIKLSIHVMRLYKSEI